LTGEGAAGLAVAVDLGLRYEIAFVRGRFGIVSDDDRRFAPSTWGLASGLAVRWAVLGCFGVFWVLKRSMDP
jgi:hypothetical protein